MADAAMWWVQVPQIMLTEICVFTSATTSRQGVGFGWGAVLKNPVVHLMGWFWWVFWT